MKYEDRLARYNKIMALSKKISGTKIAQMFNLSRQRVSQIILGGKPQLKVYYGNESILTQIAGKELHGRERTRMLVRIRDNFTCQDCGAVRTPQMAREQGKRLFDIHHVNECGKKSRAYDSVKDLSGMITLCHLCHFNRPEHTLNRTKSY